MTKRDEDNLQREGLETARFPTGVGSNPTPRTIAEPVTHECIRLLVEFGHFLDRAIQRHSL